MTHHEILFPSNASVTIEGKTFTVKPVRLKDFERFGRASAAVLAMAAAKSTQELYAQAAQSSVLKDVLGAATNLHGWQIRRLPAPLAVELMFEVIRVNKDFFERALVSAAESLAGAELSIN